MKKNGFVADIHCHPTLRAYGTPSTKGKKNHWDKTFNQSFDTAASRWARMQSKSMLRESQTNFYSLVEGDVKVIFNAFIPVEKGFLQFRKLPRMLVGKRTADHVLITATGVEEKMLAKMRNGNDYFAELMEQYEFLKGDIGDSPCGKFAATMVRDYDELAANVKKKKFTLSIVPAIEGGHALGVGTAETMKLSLPKLKKLTSENIQAIKNWEYPPFVMTLVHMFWNQLCGHARSFKPPMYSAFNQTYGLNKGITELGWHVIEELLTRENGRRILLDIKHMSVPGRKQLYQFVERYNYLNSNDKIPLMCTHSGVNGYKTLLGSSKKPDKPGKMKNSNYHNWTINLCDEEIRVIHDTGGLIGVMLDKGLLASSGLLSEIENIPDPEKRKEKFIEMILRNMFHIVRVIGDKKAWDTVAMGSDYDGLIQHVDCYETAASFPEIQADLLKYMEENSFLKDFWFGYEPYEIINKVFRENSLNFLQKHFRD